MAHLQMKDVVYTSEFGVPRVGDDSGSLRDAKSFLVAQMYTDAVFSQDIRVIQTIVNRVDGGLPKDTEVDSYQTLFGDCMKEVLEMQRADQLKVKTSDTVMMALCKSLFDIASTDIYHQTGKDAHGNHWSKKVTPSTERKQARDSALRLVLERAGGRKTTVPAQAQEMGTVSIADWIREALPPKEEDVES